MPVVDFEQDPEAPFGSGNFRDDRGRITYLHDPDTASQFVKTLPGAGGRKRVSDESTAIAARHVNAPSGPDLRTADSRMSQATARLAGAPGAAAGAEADRQRADIAGLEQNVAGHAAAPAPAAPAAPPAPPATPGPGQDPETQAQIAELEKNVAAHEAGKAPAAPGAPPVPATVVAELDATKGAVDGTAGAPAPGAPPAPNGPPTPQSVVAELDGVKGKMVDPRTRGATRETLPQRSTLGLPAASVSDSESITEAEGRPIENVLADDAEIQGAIDKGDAALLEQARAADKANDAAMRGQTVGAQRQYGQNVARFYEARRQQQEAEAEQKRLNEAIRENDSKLDPDRYMRDMPGGKRIGMVILAALNGGFGAALGDKNNDVLNIINAEIERDIDKQKREIDSGRIRLGNQLSKYMQMGFRAEEAEALARDRAETALEKFLDLEVKRTASQGANERAARIALAPKFEERAARRAALLQQAETKRQRAIDAKTVHAVPQMVPGAMASPQDQLAQETLEDRRIQRENAAVVGEVVGHPVSIDEAKEIRTDSQDLGKRLGVAATTRATLRQLATELGLHKGPNGWEGKADPGSRPFGLSVTDRAKKIDQFYALLKRADIMGMPREPSAKLQDEFGRIVERPFFDDQIAQQLNSVETIIGMAEAETRRGFSDEAIAFYDRRSQKVPPRKGGAGAGAPPRAKTSGAPAKAEPLAAPEAPPTLAEPPPERNKPRGGLRAE